MNGRKKFSNCPKPKIMDAHATSSGSTESPHARKVAAENRMGVPPEGQLKELAFLLQRGITDTLSAPSSSSTDSRTYSASGSEAANATFHTHSPRKFAEVRLPARTDGPCSRYDRG